MVTAEEEILDMVPTVNTGQITVEEGVATPLMKKAQKHPSLLSHYVEGLERIRFEP